MAENFKEKLNQSMGDEVVVPCITCTGKTAHEVLVSVDQTGHDSAYDISWNRNYQIIRCKGCKATTFRAVNSNSDDHIQTGENEWEERLYENLYPLRLEGRKGLEDEVRFLPVDTQRVYQETWQALANNSPVLAGIGLRALVETVCKEKNAIGKNLLEKIDNLADQKVLTPAGANILHKIRTLGNASAHEVKPHSERQLGFAMDVVEHLLKDVYILPRLVNEEFK